MKYTSRNPSINKRLFVAVFTPSWLSAVVCILVGLFVSVGVVFVSGYRSSALRLDVITYKTPQGATAYHAASSGLLANPFIGNLPLIAFWTIVGFAVYLFAINIFRAISSTAELKDEMDYVNVNRHDLLWSAIEQLLVHLGVLIIWVAYILFFLHQILPYCINLALVGTTQITSPLGGGYALLATVVLALAMHLHAIFLRLLLLRPRVFSRAVYID